MYNWHKDFTSIVTCFKISSKFEFTNLKCTALDRKFADFEYCHLRSVNRTYKYMSVKVNLFKTPITKIKVNGALFKRFSGYRPFMYNVTIDACRFLNNTESNPVAGYLYNFFNKYSNMNHTCPYDHDLQVEKLPIEFVNYQTTKVLPFPEGDYLLELHWYAYDINRAVVKVYGTLS
ncbi:uncharacterized protein [Drosophila pseudoobscura]|uniref:MD-2-related lipid-recognition domain-containing protein n=1 Tax=Drosophila pseudoobscura pseudoobscura TaxID=46245 RepID=A0A6I8VMK6_DROPS|nr:uncharacterized protein LOC6896672 [Drosophila pseudoobscura]